MSPNQMNVYIPAGAAAGPANVEFPFTDVPPGVDGGIAYCAGNSAAGSSRDLHRAENGTGSGVAAATAIQVGPVGQSPVTVFTCSAPGNCTPVPINLGNRYADLSVTLRHRHPQLGQHRDSAEHHGDNRQSVLPRAVCRAAADSPRARSGKRPAGVDSARRWF